MVKDPAAWYVADMEKDKSWLYELTEEVHQDSPAEESDA